MRAEILSLGRSSLVYGTGQVLLRVINLLLLPVFTAYLTPADYGVVSVLTLATFFLAPVFALGIPSAIGLFYYDDAEPAARSRIVTTAVTVLAVSGGVLVMAGAATAPWLVGILFPGATGAADLPLLLVLSIATAATTNVTQPLLLQLQLERRAKTFVLLTVTSTLITIGLSVGAVVGLRAGVLGLVAASLAGQLIGAGLALLLTSRGARLSFDPSVARRLLRIGIPLIPSFLFVFVILQANRYVIQLERGLDDVGIYTIGFNLGYAISIVVSGFTSAWFPFFLSYGDRQEEARPLFGRITTYYVVGIGSLALLFFMAARPAILILTQAGFHDAYIVVGASATAQLLLGLQSVLLAGVYFAKDVRSVPVIQGISAVIGLALNVVLIHWIGMAGAGIALVAGCLVMVALQHGLNRWRGYLRVDYEWSRLLPFGVVFVVFAVMFAWPRGIPLVVEILASGAGAVALALLVYRLLTPAERQMLIHAPVDWLRSRSTAPVQ
jgi:O-antigen/teichoic acid export membrane protein